MTMQEKHETAVPQVARRRRYSTRELAIEVELVGTLGAWEVLDVDLAALADEVLGWEVDLDDDGREVEGTGGFQVIASAAEFWGAVARHGGVVGPDVPAPAWATSPSSTRWDRFEDGTVLRFHEAGLGPRVTVSQRVVVGPDEELVASAPEVLVIAQDALSGAEARELAAELLRAAELVEAIGAES